MRGASCDVQFTQLKYDESLDRHIRVVFADRAGTIWAGTNLDGLFAYKNSRFVKYTTRQRPVEQHRQGDPGGSRRRALDRDARRRPEPPQGRTIHHIHEKDGLPNNSVQALFMDSEETLWIGTRQGLSRLKNGRFTTYTVTDGLYSSFVYSIVEGDDGNLWMTCSKGVFRVKKQELTDFAEGKNQQGRVLPLRSPGRIAQHGRRASAINRAHTKRPTDPSGSP